MTLYQLHIVRHVCVKSLSLRSFFFTQKTAYEMRISDWSSDVCSSDLLAGGHPMHVGQGREAEYHRLDGAGQPREGRRKDEGGELVLIDAVAQRNGAWLVVADRLQHLPEGGMDGEIGRASWRERVCQ